MAAPFEEVISHMRINMEAVESANRHIREAQVQIEQGNLSDIQQFLPPLYLECKKASNLLERDIRHIKSLHTEDPGVAQIAIAAQDCLHASHNSMKATVCLLQGKVYELFDRIYLSSDLSSIQDKRSRLARVTPEEFIEYGSFLLSFVEELPELRLSIHKCFEQAATLLEASGRIAEACELRQSIVARLGSHSTHLSSIDLAKVPPEGAFHNGFDSGGLKRGVLLLKRRVFAGEGHRLILVIHINEHLREKLGRTVTLMQKYFDSLPEELQKKLLFQQVKSGYAGLSANSGEFSRDFRRHGLPLGEALKVSVEGIGSITFGTDPDVCSFFHRVEVDVSGELPFENSIQQLHFLLTLFGCGPILEKESPFEDRRKQMALLAHVFAPRETYRFIHAPFFYECSPSTLETLISREVPDMATHFAAHTNNPSRMRKEAVVSPTMVQWTLPHLKEDLRQKGAVGLFVGFPGSFDRLKLIFKHGLLSSEQRFEQGMTAMMGLSAGLDIRQGGAGYVFTRMVTTSLLDAKVLMGYFPNSGHIQIIIDLSALERGCYAYDIDQFGTKAPDTYGVRPSIFELAASISSSDEAGNEWMIPIRIPPDKIKGLLVQDAELKEKLITYFVANDMTTETEDYFYLKGFPGIPLDQFIHVGNTFQQALWD